MAHISTITKRISHDFHMDADADSDEKQKVKKMKKHLVNIPLKGLLKLDSPFEHLLPLYFIISFLQLSVCIDDILF